MQTTKKQKKGTKGILFRPLRILNAKKLKFLNARKFLVPETFAHGYRKFISKFFWTRTLSIFKLLKDVPCHAVSFLGTDVIEATFENQRKWRQRCSPNPTLWINSIQCYNKNDGLLWLTSLVIDGWWDHVIKGIILQAC